MCQGEKEQVISSKQGCHNSNSTNTPTMISPTSSNNTSSAYIYSTAAAYGNHYTTDQVLKALLHQQRHNPSFDIEFATRVLTKCGYTQHSFVLPLQDIFRRLTREEYLELRRTHLIGLAERACVEALGRWGGDRSEITHLFWGTMTGAMDSPTIDILLAKRLGLNRNIERTSIEGMGCLTGFRLLNLARQVSQGDPNARILVISADLRSALGNSMPENPTREDIVAVSLFRDAASAAVVGGCCSVEKDEYYDNDRNSRRECKPCYEIVTGASRIVDGTDHLVDYFEANDGDICLHLDKQLPDHIGKAEPDFVAHLLEKGRAILCQNGQEMMPHSVRDMDVLCHTGGPRVLKEVASSLGLSRQNMYSSWEVMNNNGNLSGASNLCVLNHHNELRIKSDCNTLSASGWAVGLSMGPGLCLEGVVLRDLGTTPKYTMPSEVNTGIYSGSESTFDLKHGSIDTRKVVHIVGAGIAGLACAVALDPLQYKVRVFEASPNVREKGYGLAIWPSTMKILRDELGITGLDLRTSQSMLINRMSTNDSLEIRPPVQIKDKGFMKRSTLLSCILDKVEQVHPGCISTGHKCLRVRFNNNEVVATYENNGRIVSHSCDLIIGADGVNSTVRKYVALKLDSREYGHMTAYRFLVLNPSADLLKKTEDSWNMSLSASIHSPCYHISRESNTLNIVVLEYDGKPPDVPRKASFAELADVVQRSKLNFIAEILSTETISDLMCYSTFHINCEPWHRSNAVIIGDAAHAYGPLTAKMANLAINDAHCLATMLNLRMKRKLSISAVLDEWEVTQRSKFDITRIRTLRHLQLYAPRMRKVINFLWQYFPGTILNYFGSIFQYDYTVYSSSKIKVMTKQGSCDGVKGVDIADPLEAFLKQCMRQLIHSIVLLLVIYMPLRHVKPSVKMLATS